MEGSHLNTEDSRSLAEFFPMPKSAAMREKKEVKQAEMQTRRKNSTQLSLFGWLVQNRPKQGSALVHLPKNLIINVFSYLRISQIVVLSQTCFSLYESAKTIWSDPDFFRELQTDKLSTGELRKIFEKGGKLGHIKQLRNIYLGKNLKSCRQKIKLKVQDNRSWTLKPVSGNLLEVFEVSTKVHKSSAFLMDNHLQEIINSSFRSLISVKLQACRMVRKFTDLARCTRLATLCITENSYISNQDVRAIAKGCQQLENLDLSGCDGLDQGLFKHIARLLNLQTLALGDYSQPLGELGSMKQLTCLRRVSLENSCVLDSQAIELVKQLSSIQQLNISGCQLLTDMFLEHLMSLGRYHRIRLDMGRNVFGAQVLQAWQAFNDEQDQKDKECRQLVDKAQAK